LKTWLDVSGEWCLLLLACAFLSGCFLGINFRLLDGEVKHEERYKRIDDFNLDPDVFVFLISTLTGGTGLNLVAANKVRC